MFVTHPQYHNAVVASAVSSFQQGDYLSAAKNTIFSFGTAFNVLAGLTLQGIVQPYNSTFMATSGFIEGNYDKALYGSIETALIFGGARFLSPSAAIEARSPAIINSKEVVKEWFEPANYETRVSRWMSELEYQQFKPTGVLQIGGGGRTYVTLPDMPQPGGTGPFRVDFNVPALSLQRASQEGWFFILEPQKTPVTGIVELW